jgi:hypothetical protein
LLLLLFLFLFLLLLVVVVGVAIVVVVVAATRPPARTRSLVARALCRESIESSHYVNQSIRTNTNRPAAAQRQHAHGL